MPPVSKRQARFMRAVVEGDVKVKGLSREEAREYVEGYPVKDLPEKASKRKGKK